MARRKPPSNAASVDGVSAPEIGKQVVITDTKVIRTEEIPTERLTDFVPTLEEFDADLEENSNDDLLNGVPEGSIVRRLFENDDKQVSAELLTGTVLIQRLPDGFRDKFRQPSHGTQTLPSMRYDSNTTEDDIREFVRSEYGGGNYRFQLRSGGGFRNQWTETLADLSEAEIARRQPAPTTPATATTPATPATPVTEDPFAQMMTQMERFKQIKETLFGEDIKRMEHLQIEIEKLRNEQKTPVKSETEILLNAALSNPNTKISEKLIDAIVPGDGTSESIGAAALKFALENQSQIKGFLSMITEAVLPKLLPAPPVNVPTAIPQTPPVAPPTLPRSMRRAVPPPSPPAENIPEEKSDGN